MEQGDLVSTEERGQGFREIVHDTEPGRVQGDDGRGRVLGPASLAPWVPPVSVSAVISSLTSASLF